MKWQPPDVLHTLMLVKHGHWAVAAALLSATAFCIALPARAQNLAPLSRPAAEQLLPQVLSAVSRQPFSTVPFVERRMSAMLVMPLESRGTLTRESSGSIEKITTTPIRESVVLTAESMTVRADNGVPKVVRFDAQPDLAAYANGLRAILAGDAGVLKKSFDVGLSGALNRWEMKLLPTDPGIRRAIRQIVVRGEKGQVRLIETTETGGDVNEMTLVAN